MWKSIELIHDFSHLNLPDDEGSQIIIIAAEIPEKPKV